VTIEAVRGATMIDQYAELPDMFKPSAIEQLEVSADLKRLLRLLLIYPDTGWAAPAADYFSRHSLSSPEAQSFLFGLERLCFAHALGVIASPAKGSRWDRVIAARGEPARLDTPGVLALTAREAQAVMERLNGPVPHNLLRRHIMTLRANAALPDGEVVYDDVAAATVEQIKPVENTPYWRAKFPRPRGEIEHLLGNFTLVTQRQSDAAANLDYPSKIAIYTSPDYPQRALTRTLAHVRDWNEFQLIARHENLIFEICRDLRLA
jgi:hypothetical protein